MASSNKIDTLLFELLDRYCHNTFVSVYFATCPRILQCASYGQVNLNSHAGPMGKLVWRHSAQIAKLQNKIENKQNHLFHNINLTHIINLTLTRMNMDSNIDRDKEEEIVRLNAKMKALEGKLESNRNELEREVQRRVELEQKFTEEAKRTTDQIEELIAKSDRDDEKLNELKNKFELYSREASSMIENFTTNREILTSQLLELKKENDYLLGKYIGKARDLQSEEINLPQNVEELQFHCLTLNEKLILATLAKERLEETMVREPGAS